MSDNIARLRQLFEKSEQHVDALKAAIDALPWGVIVIAIEEMEDPLSCRILAMNDGWHRIGKFKTPLEELTGLRFDELAPDTREVCKEIGGVYIAAARDQQTKEVEMEPQDQSIVASQSRWKIRVCPTGPQSVMAIFEESGDG